MILLKVLKNNILNYPITDLTEDKVKIFDVIFRENSIAFIHGPAGTGKTKMLEVVATVFKDYSKIFFIKYKYCGRKFTEKNYKL